MNTPLILFIGILVFRRNAMNITIRDAQVSDAAAICEIYGYYAANTFVTLQRIILQWRHTREVS